MSIRITNEIQSFWNKFIAQNNDLNYLKDYNFEAWSFGNTSDMANDLCHLVLEGKKTATCSLLRAYQGFENEIPKVGIYSVLCDGEEKPKAIIFLTHTWICKYSEVSENHAFEEGEGDRSLEYWKKVHFDFFSQYENFHEDDDLLCERFKVVFK